MKMRYGMLQSLHLRIQEELQVCLNKTLLKTGPVLIPILPVILKYAGGDATKGFLEYHSPDIVRENLSLDSFKGNLDRSTITQSWAKEPLRKNVTQKPESEKPPLHEIINA